MSTKANKLNPDDEILGVDKLTVGDFWSWAYSDILSNRNRSVFAEFIVGSALGVIKTPRIEWDAADLFYRGKKIEVKSSAYLQSWQQTGHSLIRFDIAKKKSWHAEDNTFEVEAIRVADCYVFCIYLETDPTKANVLDVENWQFYVVPTVEIEQELGEQKSIGVKRIKAMCKPVGYDELKNRINCALKISD